MRPERIAVIQVELLDDSTTDYEAQTYRDAITELVEAVRTRDTRLIEADSREDRAIAQWNAEVERNLKLVSVLSDLLTVWDERKRGVMHCTVVRQDAFRSARVLLTDETTTDVADKTEEQ